MKRRLSLDKRRSFFMKIRALILFLLFYLLTLTLASGQQLYRVSGSFSTKIQTAEGKGVLTMGTFYYDINAGQLVYDIQFPEKEVWLFKDTQQFVFKNGVLEKTISSPVLLNLTVYHLTLKGQLSNYGLDQTVYKLKQVKQEADMVISEWINSGKGKMGSLALSTKNRRLQGVIFYDQKGKIIRKQFYSKYIQVKEVYFPLEVTDLFYTEKGEGIQKTSYSKIVINEKGNNHMYYYKRPDLR